ATYTGNRPGTNYSAIPAGDTVPNNNGGIVLASTSNMLSPFIYGTDYNRVNESGDIITWLGGRGPSPSANYYGFRNYRPDRGENRLIKGTRVYTLATVTVTHVGGTETPLFLSPTVPLGDAIALVSVTSPPQAAGGNPPDVTYSVGPDVILRSG